MPLLGVFLFVLGAGIGMTMQNLVLAVQNTVAAQDLGAASSAVAFFRSLGGTIGVSVLGAVLSARVGTLITDGLAGGRGAGGGSGSVGLADLADAPAGHPGPDHASPTATPPAASSWSRRSSPWSPSSRSCFIREVALRHARAARSGCAPRPAPARRRGARPRPLSTPARRPGPDSGCGPSAFAAVERGVQGDLADAGEGLADGAAGLGRLGGLLEAGGVQPLDLAAHGEVDRR